MEHPDNKGFAYQQGGRNKYRERRGGKGHYRPGMRYRVGPP